MARTVNGAAKVMTPISPSINLPARNGHSSRGFTLLELLLVLTIVAMASILVVPNVGNLDSRSFAVQVRHAHSLLNHARRDAVVRGRPSSIRFIVSANSESCDDLGSPDLVGSWQSDEISLQFENSAQIETEVQECLEITFYPEGGSSGGTLHLSQDEREARLLIDPFSGRVSQPEMGEA